MTTLLTPKPDLADDDNARRITDERRGTDGAVIAARSLSRSFRNGVEAVRGLDLTVDPGEVFGFLGPNGAGKTTTVRMLCTLLPPTSGTATVAGLDVVAQAPPSAGRSVSLSRKSGSIRSRPVANCSSCSAVCTGSPAAAGAREPRSY